MVDSRSVVVLIGKVFETDKDVVPKRRKEKDGHEKV